MPRHGNGFAVSRDLSSRFVEAAGLKPLGRATRKHPPGQIRKLAASLDRFGFVLPILIDPEQRVVAGWALLLAAKQLRLTEVPAIRVTDLSEAELRNLRLALNRMAEDADWDREELALEFAEIRVLAPEIELKVTGFEVAEIEGTVHDGGPYQEDHLDEVPSIAAGYVPVTRAGDLWILDRHRLLCGNPSKAQSYDRLLGTGKADMMFADLPSNVPVEGQVSGSGTVKNGEFATVPGEPSSAELLPFLTDVFTHAARCSTDGAYHFVCTDWPHAKGVILAGEEIYGKPVDLCVWNKTNAGRDVRAGSLYLPRHELVFVFSVGAGTHHAALGRHGRSRTNVWSYRSPDVPEAVASNPTPRGTKPVAMVADAIRDCCNRGNIVLDSFGATGTTLIAAERTKRRAYVIERDPLLIDVAIERWERLTGRFARHADSGRPFARSIKAANATS